ncbi:uncharacterized protein [Halyomorpha halys]|nr:uncharacterized protein LOC106677551 isoform X2 [Halyomorpha halys]XP_014271077.1 uncharacterized protein LOC106677551 isoform X2 [Halyomorpha halys]
MRFKKSGTDKAGQARKYSNWPWSKHMSFLDVSLHYHPQTSNVSQMVIGIENERPSSPISASSLTNDELNKLSSTPEIPLPLPPPIKKRKLLSGTKNTFCDSSDIDKVIEYLKDIQLQEQRLDGVDHLFLSYASTFKIFRPITQAKLKLRLATIFLATEVNELEEQREQREQRSSAQSSDGDVSETRTSSLQERPPSKKLKGSHSIPNESDPIARQNELLKLACDLLSTNCKQEESNECLDIGKIWGTKLMSLDPMQRKFAEKAINDILFEADLGTLHRNSVQINLNDRTDPLEMS